MKMFVNALNNWSFCCRNTKTDARRFTDRVRMRGRHCDSDAHQPITSINGRALERHLPAAQNNNDLCLDDTYMTSRCRRRLGCDVAMMPLCVQASSGLNVCRLNVEYLWRDEHE